MNVTIRLNSVFFDYTDNQEMVEVRGSNIRECLDDLLVQFPALKALLFDTEGKLSALIISNGETILPDALNTSVEAHPELVILPMIYGG